MNRLNLLALPTDPASSSAVERRERADQAAGTQASCEPLAPTWLASPNSGLAPRVQPCSFFLPARYVASYAYPLIVWLHHDGHNENQVRQVMPHISCQNYVAVGLRGTRAADPVGHGFDWSTSTSASAISRATDAVWQAIDVARDRYSIHSDRIFLAGYGSGGTMARRIALQHGDRFAGCASLGGRFPKGGNVLGNLAAARRLRNFWGVAINHPLTTPLDFERDMAMAADARLKFDVRRYTTSDEMMSEVLRDVNVWLMSIVTGNPLQNPSTQWDTVPVAFSAN